MFTCLLHLLAQQVHGLGMKKLGVEPREHQTEKESLIQKKNHSYRNGQWGQVIGTHKGRKKEQQLAVKPLTLEKEKTVERAEKFFKP